MIGDIYQRLYREYGPQGWWPLVSLTGNNPTKSGSVQGYHPGRYDYPKSRNQRFEICVGAILTQNVGWVNVEKALLALRSRGALNPSGMDKMEDDELIDAIRPAGYYNQKAKKLRAFLDFFRDLRRRPTREELLSIWGIGKETADSMLLYAYHVPIFVVDAYTRRIFGHLGLIDERMGYDEVRERIEQGIERDHTIYQEFHALLVEHAKWYYSKRPYGEGCFLKTLKT